MKGGREYTYVAYNSFLTVIETGEQTTQLHNMVSVVFAAT
jgi:hypothetical protein